MATAQQIQLVALPQLDQTGYKPDTLAYRARSELERSGKTTYPALEDFIEIFRHSIGSFSKLCAIDPSRSEDERHRGAEQFATSFRSTLGAIERKALESGDGVGCLELCRLREEALIAAGFTDIFATIKAQENASALLLLQGVCEELDRHLEQRDRWEAIIRGIFAGNIFDLGCKATTDAYHEDGISFHKTRDNLLPRPWCVDHLDALLDRLASKRYRRAVLFVDNSGADIILGMLPLARELLRQGTTVVVAANSLPSINDITAAELEELLPQICAADPVLCKGVSTRQLQVVASGSGLPVIDLTQLSLELAEAGAGADLVVLEGMGRSIETNINALFSCDSINLGMIKHPEVAAALGGRLFDCVCQFKPAP